MLLSVIVLSNCFSTFMEDFNYVKFLGSVIIVLCTFSLWGQSFAPKERYLVDSLVIEGMNPSFLNYLDGVLDKYHQAKTEKREIELLDSLVNGFFDEQWRMYNDLLYERSMDFLSHSDISPKDQIWIKNKLANTKNNYGYIYNSTGNTELGLKYYQEALELFQEINDTNGVLIQFNNLSILYQKMGEFAKAMEIQKKHLKLATEYNDANELFLAYNNIGYDLLNQNYYAEAINNFEKALEYARLSESTYSESVVLNNIGSCYHDMQMNDKALEYFYKSIALREEDGRYIENISPLINVSVIYRKELDSLKSQQEELPQEKIDTTIKILEKGIEIAREGDRVSDLSSLFMGYSMLNLIIEDVDRAVLYADSAYEYSKMNGYKADIKEAARARYLSYKAKGNMSVALAMMEEFTALKEELQNEEKANEVIHQNYQLQYELKSAADSIKQQEELKVKNAEIAAEQAEKDSLKKQKYYLFGGMGLVALFGIFMFNRFQVTSRQKNIIDSQRKEVEMAHVQLAEHHSEIQDSIMYAKRIQDAIMPSMADMRGALGDGFVLYLPKDVVAGDFFWMEPIDDVVYFAAADCTGHGVPGAMVSVVCSNALTKALLEENIYHLGNLLDRTREIVIDRLARSGEEVKDGMDISICALNTKTLEMRWAGANNPLWIVRDEEQEIEEFKPQKQPIGMYERTEPFVEHIIQLNKGDYIYVFTDGYQDQFGGPKGKKFKASQLKSLLISIKDVSMNEQEKVLYTTLKEWQGSSEQLDDVCVIGVRV